MNNEEFKSLYHDALRHGWVTSKDPAKAAKQKKREKEYNQDYYRKHSREWREKYAYKNSSWFDKNSDKYSMKGERTKTKVDIPEVHDVSSNLLRDAYDLVTGTKRETTEDIYARRLAEAEAFDRKNNAASRLASIAKDKEARRARDLRIATKQAERRISAKGTRSEKVSSFIDKMNVSIFGIKSKIKKKARDFIDRLIG